jgi:hypothetical protein
MPTALPAPSNGDQIRSQIIIGILGLLGGGEEEEFAALSDIGKTAAVGLTAGDLESMIPGLTAKAIAGGSSGTVFRDASLFANDFGGAAADYVKFVSREMVNAGNGWEFQIHWVQNILTRDVVEAKATAWRGVP